MKSTGHKIQKIALALALVLCAASVCSCESIYMRYKENHVAATSSATAETRDLSTLPAASPDYGSDPTEIEVDYSAPEKAKESLMAADYSSYTFIILKATEATDTFRADENEPFFAEYAKRNSYVSDLYKNNFIFLEEPLADIEDELNKGVKSGDARDYVSDIIEIPAKGAAKLQTAGLLTSLRSLPFYTVQKDGISGAGTYATTQSYFDTSRITDGYSEYECLFFNTEKLNSNTVSSLYNSALNGKFTFEVFLSALAEAGDTEYGICADFDREHIGEIALVRSGLSYTSVSAGYPQINAALSDTSVLENIISLLTSNSLFANEAETDSSTVLSSGNATEAAGSLSVFAEGRALFCIGTVSDVVTLSTAKTKWGLLPLPSAGSSTPNIEANRSVVCVPATNIRLEFTAVMLTAFDAFSTDWMGKSFAKTAICSYLRDSASYYTLLDLFGSRSFCDFSYMYGSTVKNLGDATYLAAEKCASDGTSVSETVSKYSNAVNAAIKKLK